MMPTTRLTSSNNAPGQALFALALTALLGAAGGGCRGNRSAEPPVHLNPNMDDQDYREAQEGSELFEDGRAMRPVVPGTVARGALRESDHLHRGELGGVKATSFPMEVDRTLLWRGKARYDIYCTPCHGAAGTGNGIVVKKGMVPPPKFTDPRVRAMAVGQLFDVISRGVRNMPGYAAQIPAADRFAIIAYVRALQASQSATLDDVPADVAAGKGWKQ